MTSQVFWKLEHCSNEQLLTALAAIVRSCRQRTAELIAHLGEVEERRLHLEMAYGSMFDYCVRRLGLSEDEASRRIDVARLARRFPALFPRLASGEISLTAVALLKPYLTEANQEQLLARVSGKTVQQAREVLAALFPQPDVAASVRKLPERRVPASVSAAGTLAATATALFSTTKAVPSEPQPTSVPAATFQSAPARKPPSPIEPLSEARYRVQLTASASLKQKLEQARDLLRHRNPSGDLASVVERALDVLLEQLMKERFGVTQKPRPSRAATTTAGVSNATRRAVLERDGLQCSRVDAQGRRCASRAWLELDHRHPRAKGGGSNPENIRLLCRAHNRLAAEHEYGRDSVDAAVAERWRARAALKTPSPSAEKGPPGPFLAARSSVSAQTARAPGRTSESPWGVAELPNAVAVWSHSRAVSAPMVGQACSTRAAAS
jgi:hypothetical protein